MLCMLTSLQSCGPYMLSHMLRSLAMPGAPCGRSDELRACSSCAAHSSLHVCCMSKAEAPGCELPRKISLAVSGWELRAA